MGMLLHLALTYNYISKAKRLISQVGNVVIGKCDVVCVTPYR